MSTAIPEPMGGIVDRRRARRSLFDYALYLLLVVAMAAIAKLYVGEFLLNPRIAPDHLVVDLGNIPVDTDVVSTVKVFNRGWLPLQIKRVAADCGCTEVSIDRGVLNRNESAELTVAIRATGERPSSVKVFLLSNDTARPIEAITFHYLSRGHPALVPSQFNFGTVRQSDLPATVCCRIGGISGNAMESSEILVDLCGSPEFIGAHGKVDGDAVQVVATIHRGAPAGELYYPVRIRTSDKQLEFESQIAGTIEGQCFGIPSSLDFGRVSPKQGGPVHGIEFWHRGVDRRVQVHMAYPSQELAALVTVRCDELQPSRIWVSLTPGAIGDKLSTMTQHGYVIAECIDVDGHTQQVAVPIRFRSVLSRLVE